LSLAGCTLSGNQSAQRHLAMESFAKQGVPQSAALEKEFSRYARLGLARSVLFEKSIPKHLYLEQKYCLTYILKY
jgi:hypothetical protein